MLKKCSPNKRLKGFLKTLPNYFSVGDKNDTVLLKIPLQSDSKNEFKTAKSDSKKVSPSPTPDSKSIIVHFDYVKEFPKIIQYIDFESFKEAVLQILSDKIANCEPVEVQYQFGSKWYLLETAETLEDVLINSEEIHIRATPKQCSSKETFTSQNIQSIVPTTKETVNTSLQKCIPVLIANEHSNSDESTPNSQLLIDHNLENPEDIRKKSNIANVINTSIDNLQRSLAIIIMSVMLRLYGTDWLGYFIKPMLYKCSTEQEKINAITKESFAKQPVDRYLKFMTCATHDGCHIFSLTHAACNFSVDFKELAISVLKVRNFYSHRLSYKEIAVRFQNDSRQIVKMSSEIVYWVVNEDGGEGNITIVKEDFENIRLNYKGYESETSVNSSKILKALLNLNFNYFDYMLFSLMNAQDTGISSQLEYLGYIPWSAVIDFDAQSKCNGLFSAMCEFDEINHCTKTRHISPKKYIKSVSYNILAQKRIERDNLIKPGYIPWIFSHGDIEDKSNEVCPLNNHKKYIHEVQEPVLNAVQTIANSTTKPKSGKSEPIVNLVLCYGKFADPKKLPHSKFLDDFKYLCNFLVRKSESVVVLTDNIEICLLLENTETKVFEIPLTIFCEALSSDPLIAKDTIPIQLVTPNGWKEIPFAEEDFEFVHRYIAESEMRHFIYQKMTEIRQNALLITEETIEHNIRLKISKELRVKFYKCETVSFVSLNNGDAITREEESRIITELKELLSIRISKKAEPAMYILYHTIGAGATTLARKIVWQLRTEFPCVILKSSYKYSDKNIKNTSRILKELHEYVNLPILMLIDEDPSSQTIPQLSKQVQIDVIPMVFLYVQRFAGNQYPNSNSMHSFFLPSGLTKIDAYNFQEKLCIAFSEEKVVAGFTKMDNIVDLMIAPKEGDEVQTSLNQGAVGGTITRVKYQSTFFEVEVKFANKNNTETCAIGVNSKYQRVYFKEISSRTNCIFKTFQIYGIMCLGEEFRKPIKCHVKNCLENVSKKDLHLLAHLSILFAFKVVQVLPSRYFQQLCCEIMKRFEDFNLKTYIPDSAKEFAVVDALGRFRIVHSIIAEEILDCFLSTSTTPLSQLICKFLENMIFDSNADINSISKHLLYHREMELSGKYTDKKMFSNMILAIEDREAKEDVIKVFRTALPLINNHHAYSHLARYLSKRVFDFEEALRIVDHAETLADEHSEIAFVLNVKGDIYREKLKHYLSDGDKKFNWEDPDENAYLCHRHACMAYQISYKTNPSIFPLNGEMVTHLLLLSKFKSCVNDFVTAALKIISITESVVRGSEILQKLKKFIDHGDGGKDADSNSYNQEKRLLLEADYYGIVESGPEKQAQILRQYIDDKNDKSEKKVYARRWLLKLYTTKKYSSDTVPDYDYLLSLSEDNLSAIGYNDSDMQSWLSIIRKLPEGTDMAKIQDKLDRWKRKMSSIGESQMLVNFYLAIFYFIKLINCNEAEAYQIVSNFKGAYHDVRKESATDKSRSRIKEWLQAGMGFQCLRSDQQDPNKTQWLWLEGKVVTQQKHLIYVSWKGIDLFYKPKLTQKPFKDGQQVRFTVGFSSKEIRAITVEPISRCFTVDSS